MLGAVGVWEVGRRSGALPGWATPAHFRVDATVVITPGGIATALAHLGIPALNRAVKDGWQIEFSTPPVWVNRRGYQTVFSLPMGVTPEMIADKRDVLARNLVRAPLEVWPAAAEHAGYVDLWVADPGSTERLAPPYPLLSDGQADVFAGGPLGCPSAAMSSPSVADHGRSDVPHRRTAHLPGDRRRSTDPARRTVDRSENESGISRALVA